MLRITEEQMKALGGATSDDFVASMAAHLHEKFGSHSQAAPEKLRLAVEKWIADAKRWGLRSDQSIKKYLESCARTQGLAWQSLEARLTTFLRLSCEGLLAGLDVPDFVRKVGDLASRCRVKEEEGIAWLAVILLAGRVQRGFDAKWIQDALNGPNLDEEARLQIVYREAQNRGWFPSQGGT